MESSHQHGPQYGPYKTHNGAQTCRCASKSAGKLSRTYRKLGNNYGIEFRARLRVALVLELEVLGLGWG